MPLQFARRVVRKLRRPAPIPALDDLKMLVGSGLVHQHRHHPPARFEDAEFRVFSQFGDDGLIQYLLRVLEPKQRTFVEFGVETYQESNTRFLLQHDNWRGLVIDGSAENVATIKADPIFWRHELTALQSFITRENIDELISGAGFSGRVGLLSIDIDGVDWWVWECISCVDPLIVVAEYNSVFGPSRAVTVPYASDFQRTAAHFSNLYWGCSLAALCLLAKRKGYLFIGSNRAGNNAYFVREVDAKGLVGVTPEAGYVESRFRDARASDGSLTFASGADRLAPIAHLELWDLEAEAVVRVKDLA